MELALLIWFCHRLWFFWRDIGHGWLGCIAQFGMINWAYRMEEEMKWFRMFYLVCLLAIGKKRLVMVTFTPTPTTNHQNPLNHLQTNHLTSTLAYQCLTSINQYTNPSASNFNQPSALYYNSQLAQSGFSSNILLIL